MCCGQVLCQALGPPFSGTPRLARLAEALVVQPLNSCGQHQTIDVVSGESSERGPRDDGRVQPLGLGESRRDLQEPGS